MQGPRTTPAWQLTMPKQFDRASLVLPRIENAWARVRMRYCGICGSDISQYNGRPGRRYPVSLGHEFVGIVDDVGPDVTNVQIGDVVISDLNYRCGVCLQCRAGRSHLCLEGQSNRHTNRGFAGFANLDASYLWPIRDGTLHPRLTLVEPLSCVLHALEWAQPRAQHEVLVVGAGSIGLCMLLALMNRPNIPSVRFWDINEARIAGIARCAAGSISTGPPADHEYDVVFDVSGTPAGLSLACDSVRRGGTLCSMSHLDGQNTEFLLPKLTRNDVSFKVSYLNGQVVNLDHAAAIVERQWSTAFDMAISLHDVNLLPDVFAQRSSSAANKDIIDIAPWSSDV